MVIIFIMMMGCENSKIDRQNLFASQEGPRNTILFDDQWKFYLGDTTGAEQISFDDGDWRTVDLPHDWSIEDIPGTGSPLDPDAVGGIDMGYFRGGTGWYRKEFSVPRNLSGKKFFIQFDGVYMNADIWLNGNHLGNHPYGYTSFWYDITEGINFGGQNTLAVRVRNEGRNTRWYSGSGIYRHVWLTVTDQIHVVPWGISVVSEEISTDQSTVIISTEISNSSGKTAILTLKTEILDKEGVGVAGREDKITLEGGARKTIDQDITVEFPELWGIESPVLYTAVTRIESERAQALDRIETHFGIRSIRFSTEGFFLNGENILIKGGCMHHDNGPLGAAAFDRAEERRVELMKASGFNSIRCAHNPPSPAFLDACDRLGVLVIDEAFDMWEREKNPQDYHLYFNDWWQEDLKSMILRDRDHPSIIMWSIGNEIPERGQPEGAVTAKMLTAFIHELEPTRPVTSAVNGMGPDKDPFFAELDVAGYNYAFNGYDERQSIFRIDHARLPDRIMHCSESFPLLAFGAWMDVVDNPFVFGDYVWTGYDYLGEASIGWRGYLHEGSFYPWNHAFCGDIDICGWKRPQSYYRNVLWNSGQILSIFVKPPVPSFPENPNRIEWSKWHWQDVVDCWNWEGYEGKKMDVEVYSAYDEVELLLNGTSLGRKKTNRNTRWIAKWSLPYQPGKLEAVAYKDGIKADSHALVTANRPVGIELKPDRNSILADGQDLCYIQVELKDDQGQRNRTSTDLVSFEIEGPGIILAVGNSNPMSAESYRQPMRKAYQGRCLVIIRSKKEPGEILLRATGENLKPAEVAITSHL